MENLVKGGRIGRVTGLFSSLLNIRVVMQMKDHELQPIVKGRGAKTFKKWLDELTTSLSERSVAEIGISYSGSADWAKEMKESLQRLNVEKPISVLETRFYYSDSYRRECMGYFGTLPFLKKIKKMRINSVFNLTYKGF